MAATAEMPYFINPSRNLTAEEKERAYRAATTAILATLGDERDETVKMVTINCLLKTYLPYFYWVGFYLDRGDDTLAVGPYQGTLGCLYIEFGRGVCGAVAATGGDQDRRGYARPRPREGAHRLRPEQPVGDRAARPPAGWKSARSLRRR